MGLVCVVAVSIWTPCPRKVGLPWQVAPSPCSRRVGLLGFWPPGLNRRGWPLVILSFCLPGKSARFDFMGSYPPPFYSLSWLRPTFLGFPDIIFFTALTLGYFFLIDFFGGESSGKQQASPTVATSTMVPAFIPESLS